jgi:pentatricopeptide repeat protein
VRAGRREEALGAFKRMRLAGHGQDLAVCTTVMQALGGRREGGREGRERVLEFWMDMRLNGVEPDAVAYTVLIHSLCLKAGDLERGLSLLDEMEQLSVTPTLHTYNTLLFTAAHAPLWFKGYNNLVYELLGRLEGSGLAPDEVTYRALVRVCAQAGNPLLAECYVERMREGGREVTLGVYHEMLRALARGQSAGVKGGRIPKVGGGGKEGRREGVEGEEDEEIDLRARSRHRKPGEGKRRRKELKMLEQLRVGGGGEGGREGGKELVKEEEEKGRVVVKKKVDVSSLLISYEGSQDDEDEDEDEEEEFDEEGNALLPSQTRKLRQLSSSNSSSLVLKGGLLHALPSERERLQLDGLLPFDGGEREVDWVRARLPEGISVMDMQEKHLQAADAVLREMEQRGMQPTTETMNLYLSVYTEGLRIQRALGVWEERFGEGGKGGREGGRALEVRRTTRGGEVGKLMPDQTTYFHLVRMLVRAKRVGKAFEFLKEMLPSTTSSSSSSSALLPSLPPSLPPPSADTLGVVMEALGRRGEIEPALYLLEVMVQDLQYTPKEWHLLPLRRALKAQGLRHPLMPADPRAWLEEGLKLRKKPDKGGRAVSQLVKSSMRAGQ